MKKINKITVKRIPDEYPDTSYLGEYSNKPGKYAIERENCGHREFRYFNPNWENYQGLTEKEIKEYCQQDYERMESLNAGNWCFIGIKAEVEIQTSEDGKNWLINKISSGGIWGIESGSGEDYLKEEEDGQLEQLNKLLREFGFSDEEINNAKENQLESLV